MHWPSRVLQFGFDCGPPEQAGGMSVRLIGVTVGTLMNVFLDEELSMLVSCDTLAFLIRQTTTGLLDPRLATSTPASPNQYLDESTVAKMTRAINKVSFALDLKHNNFIFLTAFHLNHSCAFLSP